MNATAAHDAGVKAARPGRWTFPADAPVDLVPAHRLGRVADLGPVKRKFNAAMVNSFVEHMNLGDELAYQAFRDLMPLKGAGKKMFSDALEHGIDSVEHPPESLAALFREVDTVPAWVNWDQLHRGAVAVWRAGRLVPICLAYSSVGFGFSSYGGTKALNFTRLLVDTDRAGTRLSETLRWFAAVTTPGGMKRGNSGFKYSMRVRLVHCAVRFGVSKSPQWKWNEWGLPITNTDLFFTTSKVFCANLVDAVERLGIRYSQQEKDDIFALWRYVAYVMGVPDELNHVDMKDSLIKNDIVLAVERAPDEACQVLLHSLIGFTSKESGGYQALPTWLTRRLSEQTKKQLAYGLLRVLVNDQFCEEMAVPDSPFKHVVRVVALLNGFKERVLRAAPHDDERAVQSILDDIGNALRVEDEAAIASSEEVQHALGTKSPKLTTSSLHS
ncbi:MAG TPA: oxygenase MpaB family protein [Vicinamibacterales bacterium]|nr:oxygenase MpaB family protein [Vicinamibacterales bacterium]